MPTYFNLDRNIELSLLDFLQTNLNTDWPGTTTAKTFNQVYAKNVSLPIVLVRLADTNVGRREVGSSTLENRYLIIIDIFARSDAQRLDMSYYIRDKVKDGWIHYDFSHTSGDKSTLTKTANGRDWVTAWISDQRVDIFETTDEKDKYRHTMSFRVRQSG